MKIMLVDDSKKHRLAGYAQLTEAGHEVIVFADYSKAAKTVKDGEKFDAALLDLLMPAEAEMLGGKGLEHLGQLIDVGYALAIKMAIEGVKLIGVATDTGHHDHPAGAMMDWFIGRTIMIGESKVILRHSPMNSDGTKNWLAVLEELTR